MADSSPSTTHQPFGKDGSARQETQKKTFTKWMNAHLRKANAKVDDLFMDLRDGVKLMQLLEVLRGKRLPREKGKMRVHRVANLNAVLKFLAGDGVRLVNIDAGDLCDGNAKLTLGLIWTLILKYQISGAGEGSQAEGKAKLLNWCRSCTEDYSNVEITNFTTSWRDGLAFNAIIHHHRPDLVNYSSLTPDKAHENLEQAFEVAESELNVAALLDPEDVTVATPDEKSILTYVALLKDALPDEAEASSQQAQEAADGPAQTEVDNGPRLEEKAKFTQAADELLQWINEKKGELSPPYDFPLGNVGALRELLKGHEAFMSGEEFTSKESEIERLIDEYPALAERLRATGDTQLADLKPSADDISAAWSDGLLPEATAYKAALEKSIEEAKERMRAFRQKTTDLQRWTEEQTDTFSKRSSFPDSWAALHALSEQLDMHESFELPQKDKQKNEIEEELAKYVEHGGVDASTQESVDALLSAWAALSTERPLYKEALTAAIARIRERLRKSKADRLDGLLAWLAASTEKFKQRDFPDDISELETLLSDLKSFDEKEQPPKKSESHSLHGEIEQMATGSECVIENDEAQRDCDQLESAWKEMENEKEAYRAELEKALQRKRQVESLTASVDDLLQWVGAKRTKFANLSFPLDFESLQTLRINYDDEYLKNKLPPRHRQRNELTQQMEDDVQFADLQQRLLTDWKALQQEQADYRKALDDAITACQARRQAVADSNELMQWARQKQSDFTRREFSSMSQDQLKQLLSNLDKFDGGEFVQKKEQKAALDVCLESAGETDFDFEDTWQAMCTEHNQYRAALEAALRDHEEKEKRQHQLDELNAWIASKQSIFTNLDFPADVRKLEELVADFDGPYVAAELPAKQQQKDQVASIMLEHGETAEVDELSDAWAAMTDHQDNYRKELEAALQALRKKNDARKQQLEELSKWIATKRQAFSKRDFPSDVNTLLQLADDFDNAYLVTELPLKATEKDQLLRELGDNSETESAKTLQADWADLLREQKEYRQALTAALQAAKKQNADLQRLSNLNQWILSKRTAFAHRNFPPSLPELQRLASEFDTGYLLEELPPRADEKMELSRSLEEDGDHGTAQTLTQSWQNLETEQSDYRQALDAAIREAGAQLARSAELQKWVDSKLQDFSRRDFPDDRQVLESLRSQYDDEYAAKELPDKTEQLSGFVAEYAQLAAAPVLNESFQKLQQEQVNYRRALDEIIRAKDREEAATKDRSEKEKRQRELSDLKQWIATKQCTFTQLNFPADLKKLQQLAASFDGPYLTAELPPKQQQKGQLTQTFMEHRETNDADELNGLWATMQNHQGNYRRELDAAMRALVQQSEDRKRRLEALDMWITMKRQAFSRRDFPPSLPELQRLASEFDNGYLRQELPPRANEKTQLSQSLDVESNPGAAQALTQSWQNLETEQTEYRRALDAAIREAEAQLARSAELQKWVDRKRQVFSRRDFPDDRQSLEALRNQYDNDYAVQELPSKSADVSQFLSVFAQSPVAPALNQSFQMLQHEQVDYRQALDKAIKKKEDDEQRAKLMQWMKERTAVFKEHDFSNFSMQDLKEADNKFADYKEDELPTKTSEKVILLQRGDDGGMQNSDKMLTAAWESLEHEEALYRAALDAAKKAHSEPQNESGGAASEVLVVVQSRPPAPAQPVETNDTLPLLGDDKRHDCDCCCCRCRRSCWKCCCSTCCPECHCKCSSCCGPPCCTIL